VAGPGGTGGFARHAGATPTEEEVLLMGWSVLMPLPLQPRRYNKKYWKELLGSGGKRSKEQNLKERWL
jgi:hypothetical protein